MEVAEYEVMYDEALSQCSCTCGGPRGPYNGCGCDTDSSLNQTFTH